MVNVKELRKDYEEFAKLDSEELRQLLIKRQVNFGKASLALQRRRTQKRLHLPAAEARLSETPPPMHTIMAPEMGFDIYNFHLFTSGRDARSDRYHSHGDALKYYIYGSGVEDIDGQRFEVKAGDFMHVPANTWHGTINPNDEPLVFLAAQQFPGTFRQTPTPFIRPREPGHSPSSEELDKELDDQELDTLMPRELYGRYTVVEMEYCRVLLEVQRRRGEKRLYVAAEDAPLLEWGPGRHTIMSPEMGFDIYTFSLYLDHVPGKTEDGIQQTTGDKAKYCIAGRGVEIIGGQRIEVEAGDFIHVPANTWHETQNPYDESLRYLCWEQPPGTFSQVPTAFLQR